MKNLSKLFFVILFVLSFKIDSQWIIVSTGGTKDFNSITFHTGYGYTAGDSGYVRRSINLGANWSTVPSFTTNKLNSIFAVSASNVYVCGEQGSIYKTTNSGVNWTSLITPVTGVNYQAIDFINGTTGLIVGDNRRFATTGNGGANWVTGQLNVPLGANLHYRAVDMLDSATSYIASTDTLIGSVYYSYVHRSTNSGVSYTNVLTFNVGIANPFVHIQFLNQNTGYAITSRGYCIKTINGGATWSYNVMDMFCKSAYFVNAVTGYACGTGGGLKKTTNGGITWLWQNSPTTLTLNRIVCTNDSTGIAAGFDGTIVKTDNGGTFTAVNQIGSEIPKSFGLNQNFPNPFNPSTKISFKIPTSSFVKLSVYNILGKELKIMVNENLNAGKYEADFNASELPSGTYFYRLTAGNFTQTKKMMIIK